MIKIEHLEKSFPDGVLFHDLNLEIKDGDYRNILHIHP